MSIWTLIQIICDVIFAAGFCVVAIRLRRPPKDDPRLSRGLQLLQTKITILEDLSDRTDQQFKQLNGMLEQKTRQLQNKILEAEQEVLKIDHSMNKSMEVAEIFQDKIPHEEIMERQRTIEYVKAARLAHSGMNAAEIALRVNLPQDQVELIAKFNRDQLMFDESQLPDWAVRGAADVSAAPNAFGMGSVDFVQSLESPPTDLTSMQRVEKEFRQAVQTARYEAENPNNEIHLPSIDTTAARELAHNTSAAIQRATAPAMKGLKSTAETLKQKLVATAEDLLAAAHATASSASAEAIANDPHPTGLTGYHATMASALQAAPAGAPTSRTTIANESTLSGTKTERVIKKVVFPRIEDPKS